jgi:hypothetical protein
MMEVGFTEGDGGSGGEKKKKKEVTKEILKLENERDCS